LPRDELVAAVLIEEVAVGTVSSLVVGWQIVSPQRGDADGASFSAKMTTGFFLSLDAEKK